MEFRREIRFEPGYDYREEDRGKPTGQQRGCDGLNMRWLLHGQDGTIQFLVYTMWLPSWVKEGPWGPRVDGGRRAEFRPMAADLGRHWDRVLGDPVWETQDKCDVRPSGHCFYDGSGLNAEPIFAKLLTEGHEAVWAEMEAYYWALAPKQLAAAPLLLESGEA